MFILLYISWKRLLSKGNIIGINSIGARRSLSQNIWIPLLNLWAPCDRRNHNVSNLRELVRRIDTISFVKTMMVAMSFNLVIILCLLKWELILQKEIAVVATIQAFIIIRIVRALRKGASGILDNQYLQSVDCSQAINEHFRFLESVFWAQLFIATLKVTNKVNEGT